MNTYEEICLSKHIQKTSGGGTGRNFYIGNASLLIIVHLIKLISAVLCNLHLIKSDRKKPVEYWTLRKQKGLY